LTGSAGAPGAVGGLNSQASSGFDPLDLGSWVPRSHSFQMPPGHWEEFGNSV
jgi:hypothetical protein